MMMMMVMTINVAAFISVQFMTNIHRTEMATVNR